MRAVAARVWVIGFAGVSFVGLALLSWWFQSTSSPMPTTLTPSTTLANRGDRARAMAGESDQSELPAAAGAIAHRLAGADPESAASQADARLGAGLVGTVTRADGGPLANATVRVQPADVAWDSRLDELAARAVDGLRRQAVTTSDFEGRFKVEGLELGRYQLWIEDRGCVPRSLPDIELRAPEVRDVGLLQLRAGVQVRGRVRVDGRRARSEEVTCEVRGEHLFGVGWEARPRSIRVRTSESGEFELPWRLYPSTVTFSAWCTAGDVADIRRQQQETTTVEELAGAMAVVDLQVATRQ